MPRKPTSGLGLEGACYEPSFGDYRPPAWDAQGIDTFQGGPEDRPVGMLIHGDRMVPAGLSRSSLSAAKPDSISGGAPTVASRCSPASLGATLGVAAYGCIGGE